jgi:hypothetical protein
MNLYTVTYQYGYTSVEKTCTIVARNCESAVAGAKMVAKQNFHTNSEVIAVLKQQVVDRIQK